MATGGSTDVDTPFVFFFHCFLCFFCGVAASVFPRRGLWLWRAGSPRACPFGCLFSCSLFLSEQPFVCLVSPSAAAVRQFVVLVSIHTGTTGPSVWTLDMRERLFLFGKLKKK
eukprot:RCo031824